MKENTKILNKNFIILCIMSIITSFAAQSINTVLTLYAQGLGATMSVAGTLVGITAVASLIMVPFSGPLSNRLDKRLLTQVSGIIFCIGNVVFFFTDNIPVLMACRFLIGLGTGLLQTSSMVMVTESLPADKIITGVGIYGLAGTLVQAAGPACALAISAALGYPMLFLITAILCLINSLIAFMLPKYAPSCTEKFDIHTFHLNEIFAPEAFLTASIGFLFAFNNGIQSSFAASYAVDSGLGGAGIYFTIQSVAMVLARIFMTDLANTHKIRFTTTFAGVLLLAFSILIVTSKTLAGFYISSFCFGLGYGTLVPVMQSVSILRVPEERKASGSGTYFFGIQLAFAVSGTAGGVLADKFGYSTMFLCLIVPSTIAMVVGLVGGNIPVSPIAYEKAQHRKHHRG